MSGDPVDRPMTRPRLVASDLDGTLLDPSGAVTERTARAWRRLGEEGIETVIVTARPPRWVDHLAALTGDHGVAICGNGAFLYDVASRRMLETHGLDPALVHELIADLRAIDGIAFSAELATGFHREPSFATFPLLGDAEADAETIGGLESLDQPVGKLLARAEGMAPDAFLARVAEVIGDRARLSISSGCGLAEIGPAHVTKARALEAWCRTRGIDAADVWAFGDMPNDIPMIAWAGTGWAVANAHPDLLAVADRTCGDNTEDGVAAVLEEMLAGR